MNIFNFIKTKIQILDVVSQYTSLKKTGNYWKGHCPFHNEKTASFTVSPHKEIFYCFGCSTGGDVITFISKIEGCSQLEAAKLLADMYHIAIPTTIKNEIGKQLENKDKYFQLSKKIANWCHEQLLKSPSIIQYLTNRGFNKKSIDMFHIGYFPGGYRSIQALTAYMNTHLFLPQDLTETKILNEGKNNLYSPFEDRIIFPIKDIIGRFCGFGGRRYKTHDERAKYYNSHENDYFNKGSLLFGLDLAKKSMQEKNSLFLVEGYTDCIAMVQHGFTNTVATLGTSCTLDHLKIISRYVEYLYVMYDGDAAGQKAILRLTELCWQVDLELKVVCLPPKEDPASLLDKGYNLTQLIHQAKEIFAFFIDTTTKGFEEKSLAKKVQLAKHIVEMINTIEDPLKKEILLQRASKALGIPIESIKSKPTVMQKASRAEVTLKNEEKIQDQTEKLEKKIFFGIINNMKLLNKSNKEYLIEYFPAPLKQILHKLQQAKTNTPEATFNAFFDQLTVDEKKLVSKILLEFEGEIEEKTFEQLILQFQKKHWKQIVRKVKTCLTEAKKSTNESETRHILQNFLELKKKLLYRGLIEKDK